MRFVHLVEYDHFTGNLVSTSDSRGREAAPAIRDGRGLDHVPVGGAGIECSASRVRERPCTGPRRHPDVATADDRGRGVLMVRVNVVGIAVLPAARVVVRAVIPRSPTNVLGRKRSHLIARLYVLT